MKNLLSIIFKSILGGAIMTTLSLLVLFIISSSVSAQNRIYPIVLEPQEKTLDTLLNSTITIGLDVFSVTKCSDTYSLHSESCEHIIFSGNKNDILSIIYWIREYPCEDIKNSQYYYNEIILEKIYE